MKRSILTILLLCLLLMLCACEVPAVKEVSVTVAPTEPLRPVQTDTILALDLTEAGRIFDLSGVPYVELRSLLEALPLTALEAEGTLHVGMEGASFTVRDGFDEALAADGSSISLGAAVLKCDDGWYLPVATMEVLWGRTLVRDEANDVLFCLQVEEDLTLCWNGEEAGTAFRCNGIPVLRASQLAALSGCSMESGTDEDGAPVLKLRADERSIFFRSGSLRTEQNGTDTVLPVPAWQAGEDWYIPALISAEALGCTELSDPETDCLMLWKAEDGPLCWFAGKCLGASKRFGDCLCGDLSALAEAVGGDLKRDGGVLTLHGLDHILILHPCGTRLNADNDMLTLPVPVIPQGDTWLAPLAPVAEALGLTERTEESGTVFSGIELCETVLWLDGVRTQSYTLPEGGVYVRVADVLAVLGGSFLPTENDAALLIRGSEIDLRGGTTDCTVDGEERKLSVPTVADGSDWYAAASELLPAVGLTELIDPELDQRYYTHIAKNDEIPTGYRVPVLMYHAVSDDIWGIPELFVSPSELEKQLQAMLEAGYTAITFEDLDRIDEIEKPVMLTFDDGYDDNYTELFPLLQKYKVKATVFIIVNDIGKNHKLTEEQIREMSDSGLVSIQSHTMSHNYLDEMYETQLRSEHYDSMIGLARITGKQPFVMCYPTGRSSAYSREITAEYYEYGLYMSGPCYVTGEAPYRICRYYISRYTGVETFLADLAG